MQPFHGCCAGMARTLAGLRLACRCPPRPATVKTRQQSRHVQRGRVTTTPRSSQRTTGTTWHRGGGSPAGAGQQLAAGWRRVRWAG